VRRRRGTEHRSQEMHDKINVSVYHLSYIYEMYEVVNRHWAVVVHEQQIKRYGGIGNGETCWMGV